jgi:hypothetical protein
MPRRIMQDEQCGLNREERVARGFAIVVTALLLASCGPISGGDDPSRASFALADIGDVVLATGERKDIQLLVLGAGNEPVQFSAQDLPPFATLTGDVISLAPLREHAGETLVTVTATSGTQSTSKQFTLRITRTNAAPRLEHPYLQDEDGTSLIFQRASDGVWQVTLRGVATAASPISDADGDSVRLFAELVPEGAPFTGVATYASPPSPGGAVSSGGRVLLTGLEPGKSYRLRLWAKDALGLSSNPWDFGRLLYSPRGQRSSEPDWRTCDGASVNVTEDARHCGTCGHDCQGSTCQQGLCAPTRLVATSDAYILDLQVNASHVYWSGIVTNHSGIRRVPKSGGDVTVLTESHMGPLVLDAESLYVAMPTEIFQLPLAGGTVSKIAWGPSPTEGLSLQDGRLYWFKQAEDRVWALFSTPKDGSELPTRVATFATRPQLMEMNTSGAYAFDMDGGVLRWPAGGGAVKVLARGLMEARGLAVDEHYVYVAYGPLGCWGCPATTTLARIPNEGGPLEVLATLDIRTGDLTVDGGYLYWTLNDRIAHAPITLGSVMRMPTGGGTPEVLADGHSHVRQLRVDDTHVYWIAPEAGLFRVAK